MKKSITSESQNKTEIALKESEQRYRTNMMSVGDGVISTNTEGKVEMMNPVAEELTGWKQEEARGKSLEKIFHIINEETRQTVENSVRRVMREGIVVGLANHTVLIAKDGTEHPIADSGSPIRNEKGDITGVVLVFRDQTQEHMAQKALQESERKFREILKFLDEGYYSCMMDGIVLEHNMAFNRILGIEINKDLKGAKLPDFWLNPDERKIYLQELMTVGFIRNYLIDAKTISGEKAVVMVNSHLVKDEQGKPLRIEGTFTDFTERKHVEEKLKESERVISEHFEKMNEAQHIAMLGSWEWNLKTNHVSWSDETYRIFGVTPQDFVPSFEANGKFIHPDDAERYSKSFEHSFQTGEPLDVDLRLFTSNGQLKHCNGKGKVICDDSGQPVRFIGTMMDITERKRLEIELEKTQDLLNKMGKISRIGAWELDVSTMKQIWTDETYEIHDVDKKSYNPNVGKEINSFSSKSKPIIEMAVEDTIRNGNPYDLELEMITVRGNHKMVRAVGFAEIENREIKRIYGTLQDITERKRTEKALEDERNLLRTLIDLLPTYIFVKDHESRFVMANVALANFMGSTSPEELIGKTDAEFYQAVAAEGFRSDELSVLEGIPLVDKEEGSNSPGGTPRDLLTTKLPLRDGEGNIIGLVGASFDITERKLAEETLLNSEAFLNNIIDQSPVPMWISDDKGILIRINKACCSILKITEQDVIGKYNVIEDNIVREQGLLSDVRRVFDNGETVRFEIRYNTSKLEGFSLESEAEVLLDTTIFPIKDCNGNVTNAVIQHMDITERKQAEEEIRKLNAELEDRVAIRTSQLEATNKELEAFSYSVSHDLRAPLRHVSGYVELLNKHFQSDLPEKGRHYLDSISDSVHVMGMLIDDLLQFSRSGRMEMRQSDCDMNEIVKEVIESLRKDNPDRKIEWVLRELPFVNGDEAMLRLVWTNLLSNAVKFTRPRKKARIEIGFSKEKKELVFFVHDNGVGFDMQYAQKLFGVFQRLHPTEEFEGTGIGLANVQRIVLRHGGRTWAEAKPDKGAVFYFSIPNK